MPASKKQSKRLAKSKTVCERKPLPPTDNFEARSKYIITKVEERKWAGSKILTPQRELARLTYSYGRRIDKDNLIHKLRDYVIARDGNNGPKGGDDVFKWVLNLLNPPGDRLFKVDAIRKIRVETNFAFQHDISSRHYLIFSALFRNGKDLDEDELKYLESVKKSLLRTLKKRSK